MSSKATAAERNSTEYSSISEKKVIDILKNRYKHDLSDYFRKHDHTGVKYFFSDMGA